MRKPLINPGIIKRLKSFFAIIQDTDTATRYISAGKYVLYKNIACHASQNIESGDTLALGTNLVTDSDGFVNCLNDSLKTKVNTTDIVNVLTSNDSTKPLSAAQGKVLNDGLTTLNSNKTNYLLVNATSYAYDTKEGWDYAYGQIPDAFGGFVKVNFQNGYTIVGTAYKQNSLWGSIIGHLNSNHFPFFYNVNSGTSTLDGVTLNSNISSEAIAASSFTVRTGTIDGAAAGYKVLGLFNVRLIVRGVTISNAAAFAQITNSKLYPLTTTYLRVFDYATGKPINGSFYLTATGALTYYGDQLSDKQILIHDCFAVKG